MPKLTSKSAPEGGHVDVTLTLKKRVPLSLFTVYENDMERPARDAEDVLLVLGGGATAEAWSETWEYGMWDNNGSFDWELEVKDVET